MKSFCVFAFFVALMLLVAGCAPAGPETHKVTGTVTFDGERVTNGTIAFRDTDGQTRGCGGPIVDGKFEFDASPGSKKVEITAMREVPGKMDTSNPGEEVPLMEQYIPDQYNAETTLTAEVPSSGPLDFELTSK